MQDIKLIIGNKNYSSWSLRPWLLMKVHDITFEEQLSEFDFANQNQHYLQFSPAKKVPVIQHGDLTVWDSLAIMEYLAESYPAKNLWPNDMCMRAHARSIACEMHGGFMDLRSQCPMNINRKPSRLQLTEDTLSDVERVEMIWSDCLNKYKGPFLLGEFTIADAMFAPVVNRLQAYQIKVSEVTRDYCSTITELDAWKQWVKAAKEEPWKIAHAEA